MILISSIRDQAVAGMIEELLRESGLHPVPSNTSAHVSVAGAEQWYDIRVPKDEESKAREIIKSAGYESTLR
jgi:hypothetical protein